MTLAMAEPLRRARATIWSHRRTETGLLAVWFLVTATTFPGDAALLYGLTLYVLAGVWLRRRDVAALARRAWPLLLLPAFALASVAWSPAPPTSLRSALQLSLTVLICFYVAARYGPRQAVFAIFLAGFAILAVSAPEALAQAARGEDARGVFDHKNVFAKRLGVFALAAGAVAADRSHGPLWRLSALGGLGAALGFILLSNSATGLLATALGLVVFSGCVLVWRPARGARALVAAGAVALTVGGGFAMLEVARGADLPTKALQALGRDTTLTGRTMLWTAAQREIAERPLLGTGQAGFWRPDNPDAQVLLDLSYKPRRTLFTFHNSWIEIAVALGLVGAALAVVATLWSMLAVAGYALRDGAPAAAFFLAALAVALVRSIVESDLFLPLETVQMIVWIGAGFAVREGVR